MEKKVISAEENKILKKMFWRSHMVFANFNMTKMEANGFTMTMSPAVESIYKDDMEGKKAAYAATRPSSTPTQLRLTLLPA